jgi:hypothetical protein
MRRRVALTTFILLLLAGCGAASPTQTAAPVQSAVSAGGAIRHGNDAPPAASPDAEIGTEHALTCESTSGSVAAISSFSDLTWASERIVVGEVAKLYPSVPDPKAPQQPLYTEFDVHVDENLRGQAIEMLRVRHGGGEIPGGCSDPQGATPVHVGDRFIFFLGFQVEHAEIPTYFVIGEQQGLWKLNGDRVDDVLPWYSEFSGRPITDVGLQVSASLAAAPPERPIAGHYPVVTLNQAPLGPDLPSPATPVP